MMPTLQRDPRVSVVAAADPRTEARVRFEADFGGRTYETVAALCDDEAVDVLYVATPHQLHADHACLGAAAGKHLLIEKPMALTLREATQIIEAAAGAGVHVIVGHSHSFDAPILKARKLIESGVYGGVRMITAVNYTDFLYRPRRPEELQNGAGPRCSIKLPIRWTSFACSAAAALRPCEPRQVRGIILGRPKEPTPRYSLLRALGIFGE